MRRPVHFLIYLNRSGSTLLAQKLSEFEDIAVGLECRLGKKFFPDFYVENTEQLQFWLDRAYEDEKFRNWNVDRDVLFNRLQQEQKPFRINKFLEHALDEHYKNDSAKM